MNYDPRNYWTRRPLEQGPDYVGPGGLPQKTAHQKVEFIDAINFVVRSHISIPIGSLLDFGCGSGRFSLSLSKLTTSYLGVDISPTGIAQAKIRHPATHFLWMSSDKIPLPQSMIDVVVAITVFQHIPNREARHWAAQLRRVLKDTGKVLIIEGTTGYGEHMFLRSAGVIGALLRRRVVVSASLIDHYIALLAR